MLREDDDVFEIEELQMAAEDAAKKAVNTAEFCYICDGECQDYMTHCD